MAESGKRTFETSSLEETNAPLEVMGKRKRLLSCHSNRNSSTESLMSNSNSVHNSTDNELSSESEFEEHDYCLQKKDKIRGSRKNEFSGNGDFGNRTSVRSSKPKCNSKNAVLARINRIKKKNYINNLETRNAELEVENKALKDLLNRKLEEIHSLKRETLNLRNVIRNRTEIGSLLKCIHMNTNLQISSSLLNEMSACSFDNPSDTQSHTSATVSNEEPALTEEGNGGLNDFISSINSPVPIITNIFDKDNLDFGLDTPALDKSFCEFENQMSQLNRSELMTDSKLELINFDGLSRCETPSKGFDDFCNKENLFDEMGVCFHIANKKVSLEFCDTCNINASL